MLNKSTYEKFLIWFQNHMLIYDVFVCIQEFLNRLVRDHGRIDLEWLREIDPDQVK